MLSSIIACNERSWLVHHTEACQEYGGVHLTHFISAITSNLDCYVGLMHTGALNPTSPKEMLVNGWVCRCRQVHISHVEQM